MRPSKLRFIVGFVLFIPAGLVMIPLACLADGLCKAGRRMKIEYQEYVRDLALLRKEWPKAQWFRRTDM